MEFPVYFYIRQLVASLSLKILATKVIIITITKNNKKMLGRG